MGLSLNPSFKSTWKWSTAPSTICPPDLDEALAAKAIDQVGEGSVGASAAEKTGFSAFAHVGHDFDAAPEVAVA